MEYNHIKKQNDLELIKEYLNKIEEQVNEKINGDGPKISFSFIPDTRINNKNDYKLDELFIGNIKLEALSQDYCNVNYSYDNDFIIDCTDDKNHTISYLQCNKYGIILVQDILFLNYQDGTIKLKQIDKLKKYIISCYSALEKIGVKSPIYFRIKIEKIEGFRLIEDNNENNEKESKIFSQNAFIEDIVEIKKNVKEKEGTEKIIDRIFDKFIKTFKK